MNEYFMFALALSPLLLMVFLILKLKMAIHYSVLISLVFTAALSALFWEMPVQNLKAAIGYGALKGLWPIVIVILGAIFSYNVMQATKALDILRDIRERTELPLAAYQVSGEYAMIKFAAQAGAINEDAVILESLAAIKRAGADIIFSYFALDLAERNLL